MSDSATARRKYLIRTVLFMGGYAAINAAAISGAFDDMRSPGAWLFAGAASAPVVGHIWASLAYMRESAEFVGTLMAKRFIVATGLSTALVSAWGLLEMYGGAAHFPTLLFYPLLWTAFAAVVPFIRSTR